MLTGRSAGLCGGTYDSGQGGNEYKAGGSAARSEKTDDSSGGRLILRMNDGFDAFRPGKGHFPGQIFYLGPVKRSPLK